MSPLPELNLSLGMTDNPGSPMYAGAGEREVVTRVDSGLRKHTISIVISDQEVGKVNLMIGDKEIEIPTYKLSVTDDKTNEAESYQVTRDTLSFVKKSTKKSLLSFLGFKRFDKTSFLYENIAFEPSLEKIEKYDISSHRKLTEDSLTYHLSRELQHVLLFSGNINEFKKPDNVAQYFIIVDNHHGKSFIGDILYREKFLKLTPRVELQIIKRNKVPKNMEVDEKGHIQKLVYL